MSLYTIETAFQDRLRDLFYTKNGAGSKLDSSSTKAATTTPNANNNNQQQQHINDMATQVLGGGSEGSSLIAKQRLALIASMSQHSRNNNNNEKRSREETETTAATQQEEAKKKNENGEKQSGIQSQQPPVAVVAAAAVVPTGTRRPIRGKRHVFQAAGSSNSSSSSGGGNNGAAGGSSSSSSASTHQHQHQHQLWSDKTFSNLTEKDAKLIREAFDIQLQQFDLSFVSSSRSSASAAALSMMSSSSPSSSTILSSSSTLPLRCWEELGAGRQEGNDTGGENKGVITTNTITTSTGNDSSHDSSSDAVFPNSNSNSTNSMVDAIIRTLVKSDTGGYGFHFPSPIQMQGIPIALKGNDLIGIAETGSGKTLAYVIPAVLHTASAIMLRQRQEQQQQQQQLTSSAAPSSPSSSSVIASALQETGPDTLVVVPTRELALQVVKHVERFAAAISSSSSSPTSTSSASSPPGDNNTTTTTTRTVSSVSVSVLCVSGGQKVHVNEAELRAKKPSMLVGTLGQLHKLLEQRSVSLNRTTLVVIDEADAMLEEKMDEQLVSVLEHTPRQRQTIMYSATFLPELEKVAKRILRQPFFRVYVKYRFPTITQRLFAVPPANLKVDVNDGDGTASSLGGNRDVNAADGDNADDDEEDKMNDDDDALVLHPEKLRLVQKILKDASTSSSAPSPVQPRSSSLSSSSSSSHQLQLQGSSSGPEKVAGGPVISIVFVRTQQSCEMLTHMLEDSYSVVTGVHGGLSTDERRRRVSEFIGRAATASASAAVVAKKQVLVLIATDVLARGIDIPNVTHVINFDVPQERTPQQSVVRYIHRIGRTGRGGRDGTAISLVVVDDEEDGDDDDEREFGNRRYFNDDDDDDNEDEDDLAEENGKDREYAEPEDQTSSSSNKKRKQHTRREQKRVTREFLIELKEFLQMCGVPDSAVPKSILRAIRTTNFGASIGH